MPAIPHRWSLLSIDATLARMKKEIISLFSMPLYRTIAYMLVFIFGAVLFEFLRYAFHYSRTATPGLILIAIFVTIGFFAIHQRTLLSRIASSSVLFALSFLSMSLGSYPIPAPYILLLALVTSFIGSRPLLHAKYPPLQIFLSGVCMVAVALLFVYFFMHVQWFI